MEVHLQGVTSNRSSFAESVKMPDVFFFFSQKQKNEGNVEDSKGSIC